MPEENSPRKHQHGFTVLETLVAAFITSLILFGGVVLFAQVARASERSRASSNAVQSAGLGMQWASSELGEAYGLMLPSDFDPYWNAAALGATTSYISPNPSFGSNGFAATLDAAVFVFYPPTDTTKIKDSAGATLTTASFDRTALTVTKTGLIFRGNADGSSNPTAGTHLWFWLYNNGALASKRVIRKDLSEAWNAVQFVRTGKRTVVIKLVASQSAYGSKNQSSDNFGSGEEVVLTSGRSVRLQNSALPTNTVIVYPLDPSLLPPVNTAPTPTPSPSPTAPPATAPPGPTPPPGPATPLGPATPTPPPTPVPSPTPVPTPTPEPESLG
jgi:type II secretory pathway pseudopilin PulG